MLGSALAISGQFKVVRVYDGDTFKAVGHDIEIKVRLAGIDTPETSKRKLQSGQPYSVITFVQKLQKQNPFCSNVFYRVVV